MNTEITLPKDEKISRNAALSHFLLMFGYKLFSLYFPLFLIAKGMSLPQVGYTYLLIYLTIAIFSPLVGFANHRINPAKLAIAGIAGYGIYSLGMIFILSPILFFFLQVVLGISAALFFVSFRAILMGYPLKNHDRSFGWFYSSPIYANILAPAIGALIIWKFGFTSIFILSFVIHFFNIFFCSACLLKPAEALKDHGFKIQETVSNFQKIFKDIFQKNVLPFLLISFSTLIVGGFYGAFFVLYLKNSLSFSQNQILLFGSISSLVFVPISLLIIKRLAEKKSEKNIIEGGFISGLSSVLLGAGAGFLNFLTVLTITTVGSIGDLMANSGRSGLFTKKMKNYPEETAAIDTIFSPLGTAIGSLLSGVLIGLLGFNLLFIFGGLFILATTIIAKILTRR